MADVMIHEFLLGFIKIYILQFADKEPVYGKEIHDQLEEFGFKISFGTLYNTFHGFEEKGYLVHEERNVNGKIRKYYRITKHGREALATAKGKARELFTALYE
ncbi:MAG TPA: PadR family transcriptional regulator [Spirochaetota bacterium]|nr:PadR family transcriptional regulator [Spirochaetota bacterium]HNT12700.1 PadR family transcriptional regulator [Spirochaetota bacterium]HNV45776.1 PadR family transcriptional regulator [Spirochaetota bacterium]HOS38169.1 PadR family transcriptional regulator [Spirochaetota bacterium]HPI23692.1 PadR family transcriptional regulator [Spirochaetota bacterium]